MHLLPWISKKCNFFPGKYKYSNLAEANTRKSRLLSTALAGASLCISMFLFACALSEYSNDELNTKTKNKFIIGVKIYEHKGSLSDLFKEWRSLSINTVFVSPLLYSKAEFRELAKKHNITTFLILPVFYNPEELEKKPDLYAITNKGKKAREDWVTFVCPTRQDYRKQRVEYIKKIIRDLNPDGISLDFIRFFVYWEMIYQDRIPDYIPNTCFDSNCLDSFQKDRKIKIPEDLKTIESIAQWIMTKYPEEWMDWKCQIITSMVKEIVEEARKIKPNILINVHAVPWRKNDFDGAIKKVAGQDFAEISEYTDFLSPMCYHHMLKRHPSWIHWVVRDIQAQAKCHVLPSIQVKEAYLTTKLTLNSFREALLEALKPPSRGVVFWNWESLERDTSKKNEIKAVIKQKMFF